jgi:hypothetical protein
VDVFKVPEEMSEKLVTPGTTGLAAVQVGDGLGFVTLRAEISRSAASSVAGADGLPAMTKFDNKGLDTVSE